MGIRFRRRVKICPGLYINFSTSGASLTAGIPGASVNFGAKGTYLNAGIPGTGLYARERISSTEHNSPNHEPMPVIPAGQPTEIKTHDVEALTGMEFAETKAVIIDAYQRRQELEKEIRSERRRLGWLILLQYLSMLLIIGFFWKRPANSVKRRKEKIAELSAQQADCCIDLDAVFDDEKKCSFLELENAFKEMSSSDAIWDTTSSIEVDKVKERSIASAAVNRSRVRFTFAKVDVLKSNHDAFHLENSNGPDIYIYPAFILFKDKQSKIGILGYNEIELEHTNTSFISSRREASDAKQIGSTWKKVNKNGTPDKRYKDNYEIPIYVYGDISVASTSGLNEQFLISNADAAKKFANAFLNYRKALTTKE